MQIILYTTNCSKCKILESKLDDKGIKYEVCSDVKVMMKKGFMSAPLLEVDGKVMAYMEAVNWVKEI